MYCIYFEDFLYLYETNFHNPLQNSSQNYRILLTTSVMAENKTKPTEQSVESFLENLDDQQKISDSYSLIELMRDVTGCEPKMWGSSIIGFDQYHYKYASGREGDFLKVGFSPRKRELSIYLMCDYDNQENLMKRLGKHRTGKSCLYVKKLEDIDLSVLRELVEESVKFVDDKYGETDG